MEETVKWGGGESGRAALRLFDAKGVKKKGGRGGQVEKKNLFKHEIIW